MMTDIERHPFSKSLDPSPVKFFIYNITMAVCYASILSVLPVWVHQNQVIYINLLLFSRNRVILQVKQ